MKTIDDLFREEMQRFERQPGEMTVAEFADKYGIDYQIARLKLKSLERRGLAKSRKPGRQIYWSVNVDKGHGSDNAKKNMPQVRVRVGRGAAGMRKVQGK